MKEVYGKYENIEHEVVEITKENALVVVNKIAKNFVKFYAKVLNVNGNMLFTKVFAVNSKDLVDRNGNEYDVSNETPVYRIF
jgi:hypothetical protein